LCLLDKFYREGLEFIEKGSLPGIELTQLGKFEVEIDKHYLSSINSTCIVQSSQKLNRSKEYYVNTSKKSK
jgi:hypothetical protein